MPRKVDLDSDEDLALMVVRSVALLCASIKLASTDSNADQTLSTARRFEAYLLGEE